MMGKKAVRVIREGKVLAETVDYILVDRGVEGPGRYVVWYKTGVNEFVLGHYFEEFPQAVEDFIGRGFGNFNLKANVRYLRTSFVF